MRNNEQEGSRPNELDRLRKMLDDAGIPYDSYQELHPALNSDIESWKENFLACIEGRGECAKYGRNQIIYGRW